MLIAEGLGDEAEAPLLLRYALVYVDFDADAVERALAALTGVDYAAVRELFWAGKNDTSILVDYFRDSRGGAGAAGALASG